MSTPVTRRAALLAGSSLAALAAISSLPAAEPVKRQFGPRFKFSLAAYSYRDILQGKNASITLADFIDDCAKFGLEGTELTSYYFPNPVTKELLALLKAQAFRLGLEVSGTAVGNDFGLPAGPKRDEQIALVKRWVDYSEILGARAIRVFAGHTPKDGTDEEAHKQMVAGLEECCEYAGQHGIYLALENHGGPTATPDGLLKIIKDVKSPWMAVNLDTGNFHGKDIYAELEAAAPYAVNVQVKVVIAPAGGSKQPMDYKRLAKILTASGYRGYIVLEYEEAGDPRTECPKHLDQIRAAFA